MPICAIVILRTKPAFRLIDLVELRIPRPSLSPLAAWVRGTLKASGSLRLSSPQNDRGQSSPELNSRNERLEWQLVARSGLSKRLNKVRAFVVRKISALQIILSLPVLGETLARDRQRCADRIRRCSRCRRNRRALRRLRPHRLCPPPAGLNSTAASSGPSGHTHRLTLRELQGPEHGCDRPDQQGHRQ
jgi:hypothetical protein